MVLDQASPLAHTVDMQVTRCGYCPRRVTFLPTLFGGHALCFDAQPMPVTHDRDHCGWLPGPYVIDGKIHIVYSPSMTHPYTRRRRHPYVMQLHVCSGQTRAVSA